MRQKRRITAFLLLVLFSVHWCNINLFSHAHILNGHTYVHSHPFTGSSGNPGHSHSAQQFHIIAQLTLLLTTAATFVFFAALLPALKFILAVPDISIRRSPSVRTPGLRAPPCA